MVELKVKLSDGTFVTVTDIDLSHGVEIVGIPETQEHQIYLESSNGGELHDFVGEKSTRERER